MRKARSRRFARSTGASRLLISYKIEPFYDGLGLLFGVNLDIDQIERKISKKTKALLIPNLIGNIPDWKKIRKIANKYKLLVIEDSEQPVHWTRNIE